MQRAPVLTGLGGSGGDLPPRLQGHARSGERHGEHSWLLAASIRWGELHKRAAEAEAYPRPQQVPFNAAASRAATMRVIAALGAALVAPCWRRPSACMAAAH